MLNMMSKLVASTISALVLLVVARAADSVNQKQVLKKFELMSKAAKKLGNSFPTNRDLYSTTWGCEIESTNSSACDDCVVYSTNWDSQNELTDMSFFEGNQYACSFDSSWDFAVGLLGLSTSEASACEECEALVEFGECVYEEWAADCADDWVYDCLTEYWVGFFTESCECAIMDSSTSTSSTDSSSSWDEMFEQSTFTQMCEYDNVASYFEGFEGFDGVTADEIEDCESSCPNTYAYYECFFDGYYSAECSSAESITTVGLWLVSSVLAFAFCL